MASFLRALVVTTALVLALGTVATVALVAGESPAMASHYALVHADFVSAAERSALSRAGILDTEVLLGWLTTPKKRAWVERETGITLVRLEALATQCDLLRVPGFGPTMVGPLQKSGIRDSEDLAYADPQDLLDRLRVATRGTAQANRLPDISTVATWVAEARRLRPMLVLDRLR